MPVTAYVSQNVSMSMLCSYLFFCPYECLTPRKNFKSIAQCFDPKYLQFSYHSSLIHEIHISTLFANSREIYNRWSDHAWCLKRGYSYSNAIPILVTLLQFAIGAISRAQNQSIHTFYRQVKTNKFRKIIRRNNRKTSHSMCCQLYLFVIAFIQWVGSQWSLMSDEKLKY